MPATPVLVLVPWRDCNIKAHIQEDLSKAVELAEAYQAQL